MRKYKKDTRLEVFFRDVVTDPKWQDTTAMDKEPDDLCVVLGYYFKHDKKHLYLSHMINNTDRDKTTIPLGTIEKVQVVEPREIPV